MVHGSPQEEPSETPAATVLVPNTGRGKPRLSGSLSQLILQAFESPANPRKVLPLLAIKEFLAQAGYAVTKNNQRLKRELRTLVSHGLLVRVTGSGASASFKLNSAPGKGAGRADPGKKKAATPKKNPRKKQRAAANAKGPQSKASADPGKKQRGKYPTRQAAAKKRPRRT